MLRYKIQAQTDNKLFEQEFHCDEENELGDIIQAIINAWEPQHVLKINVEYLESIDDDDG